MTNLKPIILKPASFPQDLVNELRFLAKEYINCPSVTDDGTLLGIDIAYKLYGEGGYAMSEVAAYFFQENDLCRGHVINFPTMEAAEKCRKAQNAVSMMNLHIVCMLFHYSCWPGKQLHTLIFRDFTLFYDAQMMDDGNDTPSRFKLILHEQPSEMNLARFKQDIEICLAGFSDACEGLGAFKFVVDFNAVGVKVA